MQLSHFLASDRLLVETYQFANQAHTSIGQIRKYTGEPYIVHPVEVAGIVHDIALKEGFTDKRRTQLVQAALLHDTVEDTEATYNEIETQFGKAVRNLVFWCTDVTTKAQGNRKIRKELELIRLVHAPADAKFIKMADFISNTKSIVERDPGFAVTYLDEKQAALEAFLVHSKAGNANSAQDNERVNIRMLDYALNILQLGKRSLEVSQALRAEVKLD